MTHQPDHAAATRLHTATRAVNFGFECIESSLASAHPQTECLPLPDLRAPHTVDEMAGYAAEIEATLWQDQSYWAPQWTDRLHHCPHGLNAYGVSVAFDLANAWRALVACAAHHAADHCHPDSLGVTGRLMRLAESGSKLVAAAGGRHG